MAYVALYRKYRSQTFGELMGQEHVTTTLQNSIKSGRIGHAYLFYGARGCGKTSTARLLARALNCVKQDGPTPEPCGVCTMCVSIREGTCMDVIEMDAASETGIDDVREKIIENVQYAPGEARFKVYIIDEVHDLSAKAFDALLKTLEEPPAHVVFVLATTELHKVPITIRSRCMPFPFKRGSLQDLGVAVQRVIDAEGYTSDPGAVQSIARSAEGSWRDSLSLLEQVMAYSNGHIDADTVYRALGTVGSETLTRLTTTLAAGDWQATLAAAGELIDSGKDVRQLLAALHGHLRDVMLVSAGAARAAAQELGAERVAEITPQAALYSPQALLTMMGILSDAEKEIRFTNQHRWLLERTLLRLMPGVSAAYQPAQQLAPSAAPRAAVTAPAATATVSPPAPRPVPRETMTHPPVSQTPAPRETMMHPPISQTPIPAPMPDAPAFSVAESFEPESFAAGVPDDRFAEEVTLEVVQRQWSRVVTAFKRVSPSGGMSLEKAGVVALNGKTVVLEFSDEFSHGRIHRNAKGRERIETTLNQTLKITGYKIVCELAGHRQEAPAPPMHTQAVLPTGPEAAAPPMNTQAVLTTGQEAAARPAPAAVPAPEPENASAEAAPPVEEIDPLHHVLDIFGGKVVL